MHYLFISFNPFKLLIHKSVSFIIYLVSNYLMLSAPYQNKRIQDTPHSRPSNVDGPCHNMK